MDAVRWNTREPSVRSRGEIGDTERVDGGVPRPAVEPHKPAPSVGPLAIDPSQGYNEMPVMLIKSECDDEDQYKGVTQGPGMGLAVTDVITLLKEENDFAMNTEETKDESYEARVKQELDIGPTLLQSQTAPCTLLSLNKNVPASSTGSGRSAVPPSVCTALALPAPWIKAEAGHSENDLELPSDAEFLFKSERIENANERESKDHSYEHSNDEGTSMDPQEGGSCRYCIGSPNESGADSLTAKADSYIAGKESDSKHFKHNTRRKSNTENRMSRCSVKKSCMQFKFRRSQMSSIKNNLRPHRSKKRFKCEHCEYSARLLGNLKVHLRIHMGEKPYKCEQCKYSASQLSGLKRHMYTHIDGKPYNCDQCAFGAYQLSHLKAHMRTHTGEKPYKCLHCEYSASELSHLKRHSRTHTGEKPFKCELCEYSASEAGRLRIHTRTHTGEKPYKCEYCEYSASGPGNLKRHIRTHTGEKPYKCQLCEYSASEKSNLKSHTRTHTGEKPFKCKLCEYSASEPGHLKTHMRIHTGEKPYKCELCEYSASVQSHLRSHMRTHTGEKPYKCELCDYGAFRCSSVKLHMLTHHACTSASQDE